jgi:hypothetical protein
VDATRETNRGTETDAAAVARLLDALEDS